MCFYPTREAVQKSLGFETATKQPNQIQHYVVTVIVFVILMTIGIVVDSLGKVYALAGGFAATTISNILPAMAHLVTRFWRRRSSSTKQERSPTLTTAPTLTVAPTLSNTTTTGTKYMDDKLMVLPAPIIASDVQSCSSPRILPINSNCGSNNGKISPPLYYNNNYYPYDEEDVSTVDGGEILADDSDSLSSYSSAQDILNDDEEEQRPRIQFLDVVAVILIFWGFLVMFLSVSSVLTGS